MNSQLLKIRQTSRLICAWISTGDKKTPLACVWIEAAMGRAPSSPKQLEVSQCA